MIHSHFCRGFSMSSACHSRSDTVLRTSNGVIGLICDPGTFRWAVAAATCPASEMQSAGPRGPIGTRKFNCPVRAGLKGKFSRKSPGQAGLEPAGNAGIACRRRGRRPATVELTEGSSQQRPTWPQASKWKVARSLALPAVHEKVGSPRPTFCRKWQSRVLLELRSF